MKSLTTRDIALIAAFAALTIALGAVIIPVGSAGVPIVLQNMGIFLASVILEKWRGGLSTALFVGVGLLGVPNLSGWKPTIAAISGPTIGYIVSYVIAGFIIGAIAEAAVKRNRAPAGMITQFITAGIIGLIIMYICGTIGLMVRMNLDFAAAAATNLPFIPGDIAKIVIAAFIAATVHRALPDLIPTAQRD